MTTDRGVMEVKELDRSSHSRTLRPAPQEFDATAISSTDILGVRIHDVTMEETLDLIEQMIRSRSPHQIVTVNPEFVMTAQSNDAFRTVLNTASLSLPDGTGIVLASHLRGVAIRKRVTGVDLVHQLAAIANRNGYRIFLLGAAPGVAERAAQTLIADNPNLRIAGTFAGSPNLDEEESICQLVRKSEPHILLVAYGSPAQDLWISKNLGRINVPVAIGIGGTFDFLAGVSVRAPRWIQRCGLEWLHRLLREPQRWRRMLALPRFAFAVLVRNGQNISFGKKRSA